MCQIFSNVRLFRGVSHEEAEAGLCSGRLGVNIKTSSWNSGAWTQDVYLDVQTVLFPFIRARCLN